MGVMLQLFQEYPATHKWLVLGHMIEQGQEVRQEHEKLGEMLLGMTSVERFIFIGASNEKFTLPFLRRHGYTEGQYFAQPQAALTYLKRELQGGETLLLKGAPFIEGMVEGLLADPNQAKFLVRRELAHARHRAKFYENNQTTN
jgi:UDP-N-acetylmuramyl pentapeptide synthase